MQGSRIMVIGQDVAMVQRISRYCLGQGAVVFPYYGTPTLEEVTLFNPEVSVLCVPVPTDILNQINHPYILWSEQSSELAQSSALAWNNLQSCLHEALQNLSN